MAKASIFGSYVRGEEAPGSDIDILIEFNKEKSLIDLAGLKIELEETLGREVDVLTYKSLHPRFFRFNVTQSYPNRFLKVSLAHS